MSDKRVKGGRSLLIFIRRSVLVKSLCGCEYWQVVVNIISRFVVCCTSCTCWESTK